MKSKFLIGAVAVIALCVFGVALLQKPSDSYTAPAAVTANTGQTGQTQTQPASDTASASADAGLGDASKPSGYTMAQVAAHNSGSSCWTAINGHVYDVTAWINQHPGGAQRILNLCGTDGSSAFNAQHGGQARPEAELATFLIGTLI